MPCVIPNYTIVLGSVNFKIDFTMYLNRFKRRPVYELWACVLCVHSFFTLFDVVFVSCLCATYFVCRRFRVTLFILVFVFIVPVISPRSIV